jgi:hypothetical protein
MEVMPRVNEKKTEPREEKKKPEAIGRPRDRRLRAAFWLIADRARPRLSGDDSSAQLTAADFLKHLKMGAKNYFEPDALEQPFLAAFEPSRYRFHGPRLSSASVTVMEESVLAPGQNVTSGRSI